MTWNDNATELRTEQCPSPADILSGWEVQSPWQPPDYGIRLLGFCAWGSDFATAVVAWMSQVSWPDTAAVHAEDPGISWIELALSFTMTAGMALPLRRERERDRMALAICRRFQTGILLLFTMWPYRKLGMLFPIWYCKSESSIVDTCSLNAIMASLEACIGWVLLPSPMAPNKDRRFPGKGRQWSIWSFTYKLTKATRPFHQFPLCNWRHLTLPSLPKTGRKVWSNLWKDMRKWKHGTRLQHEDSLFDLVYTLAWCPGLPVMCSRVLGARHCVTFDWFVFISHSAMDRPLHLLGGASLASVKGWIIITSRRDVNDD